MEDMILRALRGFGLTPDNTHKYRSRPVLISNTDQGLVIVKKTELPPYTIAFIHAVKTFLGKHSTLLTDTYFTAPDGNPYYTIGKQHFTAAKYYQESGFEFENEQHILNAARGLATMHRILNNFDGIKSAHTHKQVDYFSVLAYQKRLAELSRVRKWINSQSVYSDLDIQIIKSSEQIYQSAVDSLELCNQLPEPDRSVCYNNIREDAIQFGCDGQLILSNFDACFLGESVLDLVLLLRKILKKDANTVETAFEAVRAYMGENPPKADDIQRLLGHLMFPEKYFRLISRYYNRKNRWLPEGAAPKMERYLEQREKECALIELITAAYG